MSNGVKVDTSLNKVGSNGTGTLALIGAAVVGGFWYAGFNVKNLSTATLGLSAVVVGIVLWLLLTDVDKLSSLVADNQLASLALTCVVGLELVMHAGVLLKYPSFNTM